MAFAPYGDEWRQRRQICTLHQLSPKMVQSYALVRKQEVATMVAAIFSRGSAAEIDMSAILFAFSNDILCRMVTGKKFEGRKGLFSKFISENSVLLAKINLGDYLPWLGWVDWLLGKVARVKKNNKRWDDLLDQVIKEHEERVSSHDEKDFVDVLISLQKDPVLESILTLEVIKALLQYWVESLVMCHRLAHLEDEFRKLKVSSGASSSQEPSISEVEKLKANMEKSNKLLEAERKKSVDQEIESDTAWKQQAINDLKLKNQEVRKLAQKLKEAEDFMVTERNSRSAEEKSLWDQIATAKDELEGSQAALRIYQDVDGSRFETMKKVYLHSDAFCDRFTDRALRLFDLAIEGTIGQLPEGGHLPTTVTSKVISRDKLTATLPNDMLDYLE
ncbi:cytochrome P450 71A23-like [Zingiber officinale]|uniref:cytochrome P450 71A23-like n=1 Tax=Zingiber officinale TaxID=94328 RepID=UPI001C4D3BDD|nr:cytochrome P450 71A23-like [Zingiber officinale]